MKKLLVIVLFIICTRVKASVIVMDGNSGRVLYGENINERKLIASTTKIMTSIIALENANLDDTYVAGDEIDKVNGSMAYIKKDEKFTLQDLLMGLMLQSGNDAAMVIASNTLSYDEFIMQMNLKAFKLGMYNTTFENPHGLNDDTSNYSTAYDMALLMKYAINNKDFINITSTKKYSVNKYIWYNKNKLLGNYKYNISGKIGYTKKSGQVFVSASKKEGKTLIVVSINEGDKFNLHKRLYEKYFDEYKLYNILDKNTFTFSIKDSYDYFYINNSFKMLLKDYELSKIKIKYNISDNYNYIDVYFDDNKIHSEKIYRVSYKQRTKSIKDKLLFVK